MNRATNLIIKPTTIIRWTTGATLLAAGAAHAAWGRGSTFPFATADELIDKVVGSSRAPSPRSCYGVAVALTSAAAIVTVPRAGRVRRAVLWAMAGVFVTRSLFGFAGHTDLLVPGSDSASFRHNDLLYFSPLCALLAAGMATTAR